MAKDKETQNPIEANTHWQNKKYSSIPIGLEWLQSESSSKKEITSLYHYHGYRLKVTEVKKEVKTLDKLGFTIYVCLN